MGERTGLSPDQGTTTGPGQIVSELLASVAMAVSLVAMSISMAALVFAGPLAGGLPRAVSGFVIAGALSIAFLGVRSQIVPLVVVTQDGPAVVMVAVATRAAANQPSNSALQVFILIGIATFTTGLIMLLMGRFKLGHLVRYMPNTVVAAFIAGTGWLLLKGGLDVMVGYGIEMNNLPEFFAVGSLKFWLPGLILGGVIWLLGHLDRVPPLVMSLVVVASVALFFAAVGTWSSVSSVEAGGWLIGPFPSGNEFQLLTPARLGDAQWGEIAASLPNVSGVVAVAVIALLLNLTGLEFVNKNRIDVDVELRETGMANILTSPLGALPSFHALGDTILATRLGARSRLMPLVAGSIALAFGVFGLSIAGYMPRVVVGGLLISVGIALLVEWVQTLLRSIHPIENAMSVGIVLVIGFIGILQGIAVGVVAACAVFVVRYSRIDPVRRAGSGLEYRSRVDYTPDQVAYLALNGDRIMVYQLQGFLFFGSLTSLEQRVGVFLDRTAATDGHDSIVFDFRNVTGIDSSAYELLALLAVQITELGHDFMISHMDPELQGSLTESEPAEMAKVNWNPNLDSALEQVERSQLTRCSQSEDFSQPGLEMSNELLSKFSPVNFECGSTLMRQGEPSDEVLIVCRGTLTAYRTDVDGVNHRLRRFGHGSLVGEIGFITGGARTALVVADTAVEALAMTRAHYDKLLTSKPALIIEFQTYMLRGQADRISSISEGLARSLR